MLFDDRVDAAKQLAVRLKEWLDINVPIQGEQLKYNNTVIILAIPRGGVVVGDVIASMLGVKLDIIVSRKIGAPNNPELAIGAVMPDGSYFLNEDIVNTLNVPQSYITEQVDGLKKEIELRLLHFRGEVKGKESTGYYNYYNHFEGKTVILVDDGIATGATIFSAAQWLRAKQNCCRILIIAAPVAPPLSLRSSNDDIFSRINQIAHKVIILYRPDPFYAVGQFYQYFEQVSDDEVREI